MMRKDTKIKVFFLMFIILNIGLYFFLLDKIKKESPSLIDKPANHRNQEAGTSYQAKTLLTYVHTQQKIYLKKHGQYSLDLRQVYPPINSIQNNHFVLGLPASCRKHIKNDVPLTAIEAGVKFPVLLPFQITMINKVFQKLSEIRCPQPQNGYFFYAVGVNKKNIEIWRVNHLDELKKLN